MTRPSSVRWRYAVPALLLAILAVMGIANLFAAPSSPATPLRGTTNVLWPGFMTCSALLFRAAFTRHSGGSSRSRPGGLGFLLLGMVMLVSGVAPMLALFLAPSLDNEGSGMLATILALLLGLPGALILGVAIVRSRRTP